MIKITRNGIMTYQLHLRNVLLPPERLFQLWFEGGQEVVRVHDDMHPRIDESQEGGVTP